MYKSFTLREFNLKKKKNSKKKHIIQKYILIDIWKSHVF